MLSLARMVPEASASTRGGKWEKKKFLGNELRGKTLGVFGLGNIGQEVVRRARGFEMKIIASDPYVNPQDRGDLGVTLVTSRPCTPNPTTSACTWPSRRRRKA
jgi:D-3-phosphoglycerate dehydrogenase / 2-oxoglutarate reductase